MACGHETEIVGDGAVSMRFSKLVIFVATATPWWLVFRAAMSNTRPTLGDVAWGVTFAALLFAFADAASKLGSGDVRASRSASLAGKHLGVIGFASLSVLLAWSITFGVNHPLLVPPSLVMWSVLALTMMVAMALHRIVVGWTNRH